MTAAMPPRPCAPFSEGFSLIELMVALIVLSLGLGGILFAQTRGMQALNGNSWRAQAAVLAEQVIDRARANPMEAYTVAFGVAPVGGGVAPSGPKRLGGGPEKPEIKFPLPPAPVLSPAEQIRTFKLPPGFRAELVASEPMIQSPVGALVPDWGTKTLHRCTA
jgi:prepilin-type N-terminal cleavage/methylation domain-containing protein